MLKYLLTTIIYCIILSSCGTEKESREFTNDSNDSVDISKEIAKYDSISQKTEEVIDKIEESSNELDEALKNLEN
ncbi:MAG: hypothetical protein RH860_09915 [Cytophagales bacterium]